jgi:AcrR family transcriptional regulator
VSEVKKTAQKDGRRARGERMKTAILRTTLVMVKQGNLIPRAQQIADRAGVGIRSVFRHFEDMESLHSSFVQLINEDYPERVEEIDHSLSTIERITRLIEQRVETWELRSNMYLSAHVQFWRSKTISNYARAQTEQRENLAEWLPELQKLDPIANESANAIASFEMWNRLRQHQGLDVQPATQVLISMLNALFDH